MSDPLSVPDDKRAGTAQRRLSDARLLGWLLRRIEQATGVRRETAGAYLKAAGIAVRPPAGWGRRAPAKPVIGVTTDPSEAKPANEVTTDFGQPDFTSDWQPRAVLPAQELRAARKAE